MSRSASASRAVPDLYNGPSHSTTALLDRLNDELDRELNSSRSGSVGRSGSGGAVYSGHAGATSSSLHLPTRHINVANDTLGGTTRSSGSRYSDPDASSLSSAHAAARAAVRTAVGGTRVATVAAPNSPTSAFRTDEISELRAALLSATQALHQAQKDRKNEEANAITARAERDDQMRLAASLKSTLESRDALHEQRIDALQRRLQLVEQERDEAQRSVTSAGDAIETMQRRFVDLKRRASTLATDLEEAHASRSQIAAERDAARDALRQAKREIKRLEKFVSSDLQPFLDGAHAFLQRRKPSATLMSSRGELNLSTSATPFNVPPPPPREWSSDDDVTGGTLGEGLSAIDPLQSSNRSGSVSVGGRRGSAATDTPPFTGNPAYERAKSRIAASVQRQASE